MNTLTQTAVPRDAGDAELLLNAIYKLADEEYAKWLESDEGRASSRSKRVQKHCFVKNKVKLAYGFWIERESEGAARRLFMKPAYRCRCDRCLFFFMK